MVERLELSNLLTGVEGYIEVRHYPLTCEIKLVTEAALTAADYDTIDQFARTFGAQAGADYQVCVITPKRDPRFFRFWNGREISADGLEPIGL